MVKCYVFSLNRDMSPVLYLSQLWKWAGGHGPPFQCYSFAPFWLHSLGCSLSMSESYFLLWKARVINIHLKGGGTHELLDVRQLWELFSVAQMHSELKATQVQLAESSRVHCGPWAMFCCLVSVGECLESWEEFSVASSGCSIKHHKDSFSKGKFKGTQHLPLIMVNGNGSTSNVLQHGQDGEGFRAQRTEHWMQENDVLIICHQLDFPGLNSLISQGSTKLVLGALLVLMFYVWPR